MQWVLACFRQVGISYFLTLSRLHLWESACKQERGSSSLCIPAGSACDKSSTHPSSVERHRHRGPPLSQGKMFWTPFHEEAAPKSDAAFQRSGRHGPKMLWSRQQQCRGDSCAPGSSNCPLRHVPPDNFASRLLLLGCWKSLAI